MNIQKVSILFAVVALLGGCSGNKYPAYHSPEILSVPKMTAVTTWPLGVLLTNGQAFGSEFTMTFGSAEPPLRLSGQLLVRGAKLRLEGKFEKAGSKPKGAGDFGVIWDEAAHQGYVFSEALQGYAPVRTAVRCTNLATQVMTETTERIEGHPTDRAKVTLSGSDGQTLSLQVSRAQDLGNVPLRVESIDGPQTFKLALSKILPAVPAEGLFAPPDGFTKYANQTAMLDELAARQHNTSGVKHERSNGVDPDEPAPAKPRFSSP